VRRRKRTDQFRARRLQHGGRRDAAVGLDLDEEVGLERVRDLVAGEEHLRRREQLGAEHVRERVVLLDDLDRRRVRDLRVLDHLDRLLAVLEHVGLVARGRVHHGGGGRRICGMRLGRGRGRGRREVRVIE
jgi:hypothetical protein